MYNFDNVKRRFSADKQKPTWANQIPWFRYNKIVVPVRLDAERQWFLLVLDLQQMVLTCFDPILVNPSALPSHLLCGCDTTVAADDCMVFMQGSPGRHLECEQLLQWLEDQLNLEPNATKLTAKEFEIRLEFACYAERLVY